MENNRFTKIIGEKLNNRKVFEFEEDSWHKFERNYDHHLVRKQFKRYAIWLAIPFMILLTGLVCTGVSLNKSKSQIKNLKHEISLIKQKNNKVNTTFVSQNTNNTKDPNVKNVQKTVILKSDTIYQSTVVYITETIYSSQSESITNLQSKKVTNLLGKYNKILTNHIDISSQSQSTNTENTASQDVALLHYRNDTNNNVVTEILVEHQNMDKPIDTNQQDELISFPADNSIKIKNLDSSYLEQYNIAVDTASSAKINKLISEYQPPSLIKVKKTLQISLTNKGI
ncbi:MAG: hypothetical protein IPJ51_01870 [Saprospiraceae bacterium]|nr:hypothetical protein [Saprospiraceae bacterium]